MDEGVIPGPKKVEDITSMATPVHKQNLQRYLGMATFLSNHVPKFSDHREILRGLLKSDVPFDWDAEHQHAFQEIKRAISQGMSLSYYDPQQEVTLEVDTSMKGLGAALIQHNGPVDFASKALTPAE